MTRVYRLVHERGPEHDTPFHPAPSPNHWNSAKVEMTYAAESVAICALEILSQWREYSSLAGYRIYALDLDPDRVEDVSRTRPDLDVHDRAATRTFGEEWAAERRTLALRVPSVVVPFGCNYLINPNHPGFDPAAVLDLGEFHYDERIVRLIDAAKSRTDRALP